MSGHGHTEESEYAPSDKKKMLASFVAGSIVAVGRFFMSILRFIFNLLTALVGFL